jgi:hypothetical protein
MTKKSDLQNDGNVWKRNNIPALEFCTVPRAAELLGCHINDLIHFYQIGAIEMCLPLHNFEAVLFTTELWEEGNEWEIEYPPNLMTQYKNKSPLSLFMPKAEIDMSPSATKRAKRVYQHEDIPGLKKPILFLSGLWALRIGLLSQRFFSALKNNEEIALTDFDISFKEADITLEIKDFGNPDCTIIAHPVTEHLYSSGLLNQAEVKPIASISVNDLLITRTQIERMSESVGKIIPSYINGGVALVPEPGEKEQIATEVNSNKLGEFLEMLIRCVPELGDEVMKATANKRHCTLKAFLDQKQSKGMFTDMTMPSSATIEKYFKI